MFKRIIFIMFVGMFFSGSVGLSHGEQEDKYGMTQVIVQNVEVGNKICPDIRISW